MNRNRTRDRGGISGNFLPPIPSGYLFITWADGSYELDANGNYVITKAGS